MLQAAQASNATSVIAHPVKPQLAVIRKLAFPSPARLRLLLATASIISSLITNSFFISDFVARHFTIAAEHKDSIRIVRNQNAECCGTLWQRVRGSQLQVIPRLKRSEPDLDATRI